MGKDFFAHKAADYEKNRQRVANIHAIAEKIAEQVTLKPDMHLMDFGAGTGLLLQGIAPYVGKITAVDISPSMSEQLRKKQGALACDLDVVEVDLTTTDVHKLFDGVISSMTLHHIKDAAAIFKKLHGMIKVGGFIALADLATEDGSFHQEDTGVYHLGFSKEELLSLAKGAGFKQTKVVAAGEINKPYGDYPLWLLVARV
ncbi:MAG: SAM-dependent methyltransferase [Proteobacteria bacterium]|nr:MAG: SAM-dependent methyltransferase [Pseudomonadota bacterium]